MHGRGEIASAQHQKRGKRLVQAGYPKWQMPGGSTYGPADVISHQQTRFATAERTPPPLHQFQSPAQGQ